MIRCHCGDRSAAPVYFQLHVLPLKPPAQARVLRLRQASYTNWHESYGCFTGLRNHVMEAISNASRHGGHFESACALEAGRHCNILVAATL